MFSSVRFRPERLAKVVVEVIALVAVVGSELLIDMKLFFFTIGLTPSRAVNTLLLVLCTLLILYCV